MIVLLYKLIVMCDSIVDFPPLSNSNNSNDPHPTQSQPQTIVQHQDDEKQQNPTCPAGPPPCSTSSSAAVALKSSDAAKRGSESGGEVVDTTCSRSILVIGTDDDESGEEVAVESITSTISTMSISNNRKNNHGGGGSSGRKLSLQHQPSRPNTLKLTLQSKASSSPAVICSPCALLPGSTPMSPTSDSSTTSQHNGSNVRQVLTSSADSRKRRASNDSSSGCTDTDTPESRSAAGEDSAECQRDAFCDDDTCDDYPLLALCDTNSNLPYIHSSSMSTATSTSGGSRVGGDDQSDAGYCEDETVTAATTTTATTTLTSNKSSPNRTRTKSASTTLSATAPPYFSRSVSHPRASISGPVSSSSNGVSRDLFTSRYSNDLTHSISTGQARHLSTLTYEQVCRLDQVMDEVVPIHGRANFPTLEIKLKDLVKVVRAHLSRDGLRVRDVRLNGGVASYILCPENHSYNDHDLIFAVDLARGKNFDRVRSAVLDSLYEFLPEGVNRERISSCSLKDAYVYKMVKVNEGDNCWSLISLSNNRGRNVEMKFVEKMGRKFEFSVDSFQIILDSLLSFYDCISQQQQQLQDKDADKDQDDTKKQEYASAEESKKSEGLVPPPASSPCSVESAYASSSSSTKSEPLDNKTEAKTSRGRSESSASTSSSVRSSVTCSSLASSSNLLTAHFYPSVVCESVYGDFRQALYHLRNRLIATRDPEKIRGGGLLKYCKLLVRNYAPADERGIKTLEKYMCSRFFIDFPDVNQQRAKLESYLANHFIGDESKKVEYLTILYAVVNESTVCLMQHERRQTLSLIAELAQTIYYSDSRNYPYQMVSPPSLMSPQPVQQHEGYTVHSAGGTTHYVPVEPISATNSTTTQNAAAAGSGSSSSTSASNQQFVTPILATPGSHPSSHPHHSLASYHTTATQGEAATHSSSSSSSAYPVPSSYPMTYYTTLVSAPMTPTTHSSHHHHSSHLNHHHHHQQQHHSYSQMSGYHPHQPVSLMPSPQSAGQQLSQCNCCCHQSPVTSVAAAAAPPAPYQVAAHPSHHQQQPHHHHHHPQHTTTLSASQYGPYTSYMGVAHHGNCSSLVSYTPI